jgi:hypothetical protein
MNDTHEPSDFRPWEQPGPTAVTGSRTAAVSS